MINSTPAANNKPQRIEGIVLAAGLSSRAPAFKPTLLFEGKALLQHTVERMKEFCSKVFVVGGYRVADVIALTEHMDGVEVVINKNFARGMFSSVQTGVQYVTGDRFFLIPGDMPLVTASTYRLLLQHPGEIVIPTYQERKGHPVLLATSLAEQVLREPRDSNLGIFIRRHGYVTVAVEDNGILVDIDTAADYKKISGQAGKNFP